LSDAGKLAGLVAGEVPYLTLPGLDAQPGLVHAVFTRYGGVSRAPHHTLNTSLSVGDDPEAVAENRRRTAAALGAALDQCQWAHQVHGSQVAVVTELNGQAPEAACSRVPEAACSRVPEAACSRVPEADALVTARTGVLLCLRLADCVPVLLYDPVRRAVGIAHAGWRGTVAGIAAATVEAMIRAFGTQPADLVAGIGPSIGPCCYAVSRDMVNSPGPRYRWPQSSVQVRGGVHYVDLWQANVQQLVDAGVPAKSVSVSGVCTACHTADFYSHRAERGRTGRFTAAIGLL
jgi:hypothetical protein